MEKLWRVTIDPGHGGIDPGAVGRVHRTPERDVVMSIANHMLSLSENSQISIILTRTNNSQRPSLRNRARMAVGRTAVARDAFLSLHCNGFHNLRVHGSEIFYLQNNSLGKNLAEIVLSDIIQKMNWRNRGVKSTSAFTVLRHTPRIPSILIEYDFITNSVRESQLRDIETQRKLAVITFSALEEYLKTYRRRN